MNAILLTHFLCRFDNYPQDTSWKIQAEDGFLVSQSPGYDAALRDTSQQVCLPGGNYAFTIMDVYGDGMVSISFRCFVS